MEEIENMKLTKSIVEIGVRIYIWKHLMRERIMNYVY